MLRFRFPTNDSRFAWTNHIKNKMLFYGLSEQKIRAVLQSPKRVEEGIATGTSAAMQPSRGKKKPEEIWVMYRKLASRESQSANRLGKAISTRMPRMLMISAWRYPGVTKPGARAPVPSSILDELDAEGFFTS